MCNVLGSNVTLIVVVCFATALCVCVCVCVFHSLNAVVAYIKERYM